MLKPKTTQIVSIALIWALTICNVSAFAPSFSFGGNSIITSSARKKHSNAATIAVRHMSGDDNSAMQLDPKETAVVFIEYQNEFTTEGGALYGAVKDCMEATNTLENSKVLADAARDAGCTIVHVPIVFDEVREPLFSSELCVTVQPDMIKSLLMLLSSRVMVKSMQGHMEFSQGSKKMKSSNQVHGVQTFATL